MAKDVREFFGRSNVTATDSLPARLEGQADYMDPSKEAVPAQIDTDSDLWRTQIALLREASAALAAERLRGHEAIEHWQGLYVAVTERVKAERETARQEDFRQQADIVKLAKRVEQAEAERETLIAERDKAEANGQAEADFWERKCHVQEAEIARLASQLAGVREAILWALGENGTFADEPPPLAGKYRQRFWWRTELRRRVDAALTATQARARETETG